MHIAVIGPGLIGHSITLAALRADPRTQIIEVEHGQPIAGARGADVIVLATPVDAILRIIHEHADILQDSTVIDTGSTKRAILRAAVDVGLDRFVGGHPMAGGSTAGSVAARADLFDGKPWFLVPVTPATDAISVATAFVQRLGAKPLVMTDDGTEHDRVMAAVSHLPQVVASALMILAADSAGAHLSWAGAGLRDTTRLAQSSASMWQSILATNADQLAPLLRALATELTALADQLDDPDVVGALLDKANRARALL
jgi:prephenate dehydrogenase